MRFLSLYRRRLWNYDGDISSIIHFIADVGCIGGFNQRQGEALPPQIFLTFKFVVWPKLQNDEIVAT